MKNYTISGSLENKIYVVTGSNSGIGRETAKSLFAAGATVYMACRSEQKAKEAIERISTELKQEHPEKQFDQSKLIFLQLDLANLESVRKAASEIKSCHVLINNAGLAGGKPDPIDGLEPTFFINHLGPFLFTLLLLPVLNETAEKSGEYSRIVNVSSRGHTRPSKLNIEEDFTGSSKGSFNSYTASKLANVLFTNELALKLQEKQMKIYAYSLHPGVVATDIWRTIPGFIQWTIKLLMLTEAQGALTTLYCATSPEVANLEHDGKYFDNCTVKETSKLAQNKELAKELWLKNIEWAKLKPNEIVL